MEVEKSKKKQLAWFRLYLGSYGRRLQAETEGQSGAAQCAKSVGLAKTISAGAEECQKDSSQPRIMTTGREGFRRGKLKAPGGTGSAPGEPGAGKKGRGGGTPAWVNM